MCMCLSYVENRLTFYCILYHTALTPFTPFKWNFKFSLSIFVKISSNYSQLDLLVCASFIHSEIPSKTCSYSLVRQLPLFHHKNIFKIFIPFGIIEIMAYNVHCSLFIVHHHLLLYFRILVTFSLLLINDRVFKL